MNDDDRNQQWIEKVLYEPSPRWLSVLVATMWTLLGVFVAAWHWGWL